MKDFLTFYDLVDFGRTVEIESLPFLMAPLIIEDPEDEFKKSEEYKKEEAKYREERKQFSVLMPYDKTKTYPMGRTGETYKNNVLLVCISDFVSQKNSSK